MSDLIGRGLDLAQSFLDRQPDLALMLSAAAFAGWLRLARPATPPPSASPAPAAGSWWNLLRRGTTLLAATAVTGGLLLTHAALRGYLHRVESHFSAHHGRVTAANQQAVRTIWGNEQQQAGLNVAIGYDEEVEERVKARDLDQPDIIHTVKVHRAVSGNPFRQERHTLRLTTNPRRKGSAMYAGYETDCRFTWKLCNPADREATVVLKFPLPADSAVYLDFAATWNGQDALADAHFEDGELVLTRTVAAGEAFDFSVGFRSRGLGVWYFQNTQTRELRDFLLTVTLTDIPTADLNYPEGCMTPTDIVPTASGAGCLLNFRLDHALTNKGMGVALPGLTQPGQAAGGVLAEAGRGWTMFFALLWIGLALTGARGGALLTALCAAAGAYGFGLLADLNDTALPFWATVLLGLLPLMALSLVIVQRRVGGADGWILAVGLALLGIGYPLAAGLDDGRFMLYRNVAGLLFVGVVAWLGARGWQRDEPATSADPNMVSTGK